METSKLVLIFKDSLEQVHPRELGPIKNTKLQTAIFQRQCATFGCVCLDHDVQLIILVGND